MIGRDEEIWRIVQVLSRRTKNNPVLIGDPGVEDTISILRGLKERYEVHHGVRIKDGALLTEAVRRRPYAVVLFDEIEKAHQDLFNVLLQILDDGRLTDGHGRTVDFKNTVVIMTSNGGSHLTAHYRGRDDAAAFAPMRAQVLDALRREFRPEFLNRVDEIVVFHNLTREHLKEIAAIQLRRLQQRLDERHIKLQLTEGARAYLAEAGYDPNYGARPLKRLIQKEIETPLGPFSKAK